MTVFGAPVVKGQAVGLALQNKVNDFRRAVDRLTPFSRCLDISSKLSTSKLLYTLLVLTRVDNQLLHAFDSTLRQGLAAILNIDLTDLWIQACIHIRNGGLGFRSA